MSNYNMSIGLDLERNIENPFNFFYYDSRSKINKNAQFKGWMDSFGNPSKDDMTYFVIDDYCLECVVQKNCIFITVVTGILVKHQDSSILCWFEVHFHIKKNTRKKV